MDKTIRTTVYLSEEDYEDLKRIARKEGRAAAELVREAVGEYARRKTHRRAPRSLGAGASGKGNLSERAEELLKGMGK